MCSSDSDFHIEYHYTSHPVGSEAMLPSHLPPYKAVAAAAAAAVADVDDADDDDDADTDNSEAEVVKQQQKTVEIFVDFEVVLLSDHLAITTPVSHLLPYDG